MPFLPPNEKQPAGNYMKFQEGENTFRVLSSAIVGFEYWNTENKPVRSKTQFQDTPSDIKLDPVSKKPTAIKYFWAFQVFNYNAGRPQILEITQSGIQGVIRALAANKKWGDPQGYDITVHKSGSGLETEYSTVPNPHSPFTEKFPLPNLEALFSGEDPFVSIPQEASITEYDQNGAVSNPGIDTGEEIKVENLPF